MSCLNPQRIVNRVLNLTVGTPVMITVPCGKCDECNKQKINDYFVRSYYEYLDCLEYGGFTYFETLTYNNENLPIYNGIAHFNKQHIRLFFQRLKTLLKKNGYPITTSGQNRLRYFITCEYGGKTCRPHYHTLLFVYIRNLSPLRFKQLVNEAWKFGFCNPILGYKIENNQRVPISANSWVVNSYHYLSYVCKYCVKQLQFELDFNNYLKTHADEKLNEKQLYKKLAPFRLNSNNFGLGIIKHLSEVEKFNLQVKIPYSPKGVDYCYRLPKYIQTKLYYEYYTEVKKDGTKRVVWILNDAGIARKIERSEYEISQLAQSYSFASQNVNYLLRELVSLENGRAEATQIILDLENLNQQLQVVDKYVDKVKLAQYALFYRDTFAPFWRVSLPDLKQHILHRYDKSSSSVIRIPDDDFSLNRFGSYLSDVISSDYIPSYQGCETFLRIYECFMNTYNKHKLSSSILKNLIKLQINA